MALIHRVLLRLDLLPRRFEPWVRDRRIVEFVDRILGDGGDFGEGLFDHQHNPSVLVKPFAQRLENGNTLVTDSMGHTVTEVSPDGLPVWELWLPPPYFCYKAHRIDGFL